MKISVIAGAVLALGVASVAQAAEPKAKEEKVSSGSNVVCFAEKVTGSHLKKRICMTEAERERMRKEDQEAMGRMRSSSAGGGPRNTGAER